VARYMALKGARHDRWLTGMQELVRRARAEGDA
jgi:hypothetical protein